VSVQIKKLFNEGKLSSSEERSLQEFCSHDNADETACKSYVEHLEFLDVKAKKRVRERNTLPSNIFLKNEKDVEARPKSAIYTPKLDDEHLHHFHMGVPPGLILSLFVLITVR